MEKIEKKVNTHEMSKEEAKKEIIRRKDRDKQKVRGRFDFKECPGGTMSFSYKAYPGEEVQRYDLIDGQIYELPLGVARHLNNNVWYPQHAFLHDKDGKPSVHLQKKVHRTSFQSLEFVDIEDISNDTSIVVARNL